MPVLINQAIEYLQSMTSRVDAVILVALITGLGSVVQSIYSSHAERINKRREYLSAKREGPYAEFIEVVYKLTKKEQGEFSYSKEELVKDMSSFNSKLTLWGAPSVVKKWNNFRRSSLETTDQKEQTEVLILIEEVMNEMRKDLGVKSVSKGNLLTFFINDVEKIIRKKGSNVKDRT